MFFFIFKGKQFLKLLFSNLFIYTILYIASLSMSRRLLKMQTVVNDDKFFTSISTASAVSPMYVRSCLHSQCGLVPYHEITEYD